MSAPDVAAGRPDRGFSEAATRRSFENELAPTGLPPQSAASARPEWSRLQRIGFRYLFCHAVLYMAPRPLSTLVALVASLMRRLDLWWREPAEEGGELGPATWLVDGYEWLMSNVMGYGPTASGEVAWWGLARVDDWWQRATTWASENVFPGIEVIHQATGSGDTGHDFVRLFLIVAGASALTLIWSVGDRWSRSYTTLGRWLHLIARWYLAYWMLVYGGIKLYAGQFPEPGLSRLTNEIGDTSPMGMVWTFLGASKPYEVFGGIGELVGGLLLFHRRTALLGCLVSIAVLINVCALNWLYDVPVKLFSTHLLVFAVFLMAPWGRRLWALLFSNQGSQPVELQVTQWRWLRWLLAVFGWLWVTGQLLDMHFNNMQSMEMRAERMAKPELYGRWDVEKMVLDGEDVPRTDATRWQFFAIDQGNRAFYRTAGGQRGFWSYAEDLEQSQITLSTKSPVLIENAWTIEQGKKTVEVSNPEPRTMADFSKPVDAERRTLVLKGDWQGKQLELHTVEHVFRLHRDFHWVQEMPFNR